MKRIILLTVLLLGALQKSVSAGTYDSAAVMILDRMADLIGSLESCRFHLAVASDQSNSKGDLTKSFNDFDVSMSGPRKMLVDAQGIHGHRQMRYNGEVLSYYSFTENNYSTLPYKGRTIDMIDSINRRYGIDFPAADFFNPSFTDDMITLTDSIVLLENARIGDQEYFQVMVYGKNMNVQLWIQNGAYTLPGRFAITYKNKLGKPQYMGSFSDWQLNVNLPGSLFDFAPPPGAKKLRILTKTGA